MREKLETDPCCLVQAANAMESCTRACELHRELSRERARAHDVTARACG